MSLESPLNTEHKQLGAVFTDFSGWQMPLHFGSILKEHLAVRESVGVFDISHMGVIFISGVMARTWLDALLANDLASLETEHSQYTFMLNEQGGVIDDLIVYRVTDDQFMLVPNASGVEAVYQRLVQHLPDSDVQLENRSGSVIALALQGKNAQALMETIAPNSARLKKNQLCVYEGSVDSMVIARTGYTGSDGFEIFTNIEQGQLLWERLVSGEGSISCVPCGLGARDTLRIEAGYPLYGNELNARINPLQAGLGFFLKDSIKQSLKRANPDRLPNIVYYKVLEKTPPPRKGYEIFEGNECIGTVTSGCLSPMTGEGIGFALLEKEITLNEIGKYTISVRNRKYSLKFVKRGII
jgi:aminomethyltransferase